MFYAATNFNQNIGSWNTSKVPSMAFMFNGATNFNNGCAAGVATCPMNWNTSNVTSMQSMFRNATDFNQDISRKPVSNISTDQTSTSYDNSTSSDDAWYTGSVIVDANNSMNNMFNGATAFNQDLDNWCVSGFTGVPLSFSSLAANKRPLFGATGAARCPLRAPCTGTPNADGTCP
jgi:surface protein